MIDIDIDAIRKRDDHWRDDGKQSNRNFASMDRRALLAYIDEIEGIVEEIGVDIKLIRRRHGELFQPSPPSVATVEQLSELDRELDEERTRAGREQLAKLRDSRSSGKLPP